MPNNTNRTIGVVTSDLEDLREMHKAKTLRVFKKNDQLKTYHGNIVSVQSYAKNRFGDNNNAANYYMDTPKYVRKIPHK